MKISKYNWKKTYMARIMGSIGSNLWRSFWVEDENGDESDLLGDGHLSCALHVAGVLLNLNPRHGSDVKFVSGPMTRVDQLHEDLLKNGWGEVDLTDSSAKGLELTLRTGDVVFWEELRGYNGRESGSPHGHCGFYIGDDKVVSVIPRTGNPQVHDFLYRDQQEYIGDFDDRKERKITLALRPDELLNKLPQPNS